MCREAQTSLCCRGSLSRNRDYEFFASRWSSLTPQEFPKIGDRLFQALLELGYGVPAEHLPRVAFGAPSTASLASRLSLLRLRRSFEHFVYHCTLLPPRHGHRRAHPPRCCLVGGAQEQAARRTPHGQTPLKSEQVLSFHIGGSDISFEQLSQRRQDLIDVGATEPISF